MIDQGIAEIGIEREGLQFVNGNKQDRTLEELEEQLKSLEINPEKFNGPVQKPKTANKAFGGLLDSALFFQHRSLEMRKFAKEFERIENMKQEGSVTMLNNEIIPKVNECLENMFQKLKAKTKSKFLNRQNKYAGLFASPLTTWRDFYKQVFCAYTINGFLYKKINKYLRNESWIKLDALLPYTYCLLKAFLWGSSRQIVRDNFEVLKKRSTNNKLILYRRADFDQDSLNFYEKSRNKFFSWSGVTSTSLIESITHKFQGDSSKRPILILIEIEFEDLQPENLNALYLATFSAYPQEEEVALPPGSIFELLGINKEKTEVEMRLRLVTNVKLLARRGQFMHGMLHSMMRNGDELKIVSLKEKELSRAIRHCQGNQLIRDIEFYFCTFNGKTFDVFREIITTIKNLTSLTLNIVKFEEVSLLSMMLECLKKTNINKLEIFATLSEKRHFEGMIESLEYLSSLKYLKLNFEEDCQMNADLFADLLKRSLRYLNPECIFDIDIGASHNLVIKGSSLNDFEQFGVFEAVNKNWPSRWGRPPKSITAAEDPKSINKNIEILESLRGARKYCFENIEKGTLTEALECKFLLSPEKKKKESLLIKDDENQDDVKKKLESQEGQEMESLDLLTSLCLSFERDEILDEEISLLCSNGIRHLKCLKDLHLIFDGCQNLSDKGIKVLSCQGIQQMTSLTSLYLSFANCSQIKDQSLQSLCYEGIRHLSKLTSLYLNFEDCDFITDECLETLFFEGIRHLSKLTSLQLNFGKPFSLTTTRFNYFKRSNYHGLRILGEGLKQLTQLTSLHLNFERCHYITDEGFESLSSGLQQLLKLESLDLNFGESFGKISKYFSDFDEKGLKSLFCVGIRPLQELTSLSLNFKGYNCISDKNLLVLSKGLRNYPKLTSLHLDFENCHSITDEGLKNLCSEGIQHLSKLTSLHLNFDKSPSSASFSLGEQTLSSLFPRRITDEGLKNLGKVIRHLPLISLRLNFENCHSITDEGLSSLCSEGIQWLSKLNSLDLNFGKSSTKHSSHLLYFNQEITDEDFAETFSQRIHEFSALKSIDLNFDSSSPLHYDRFLSYCNKKITDEGFKSLCSVILQSLPKLTYLNLNFKSYYQITDEGFKSLGEALQPHSELASLSLSFENCNQITDEGFKSLGEGIQHLQELTSLSLNLDRSLQTSYKTHFSFFAGQFSYEDSKTLPQKDLLELRMKNFYHITDEGLKSLGKGIKHLSRLTSLSLSFENWDRITDRGLKSLCCKAIRHLSQLASLFLDFKFCYEITDGGFKNLCSEGIRDLPEFNSNSINFTEIGDWESKMLNIQTKMYHLPLQKFRNYHEMSIHQMKLRNSLLHSQFSSQQSSASVEYNAKPGFYLKERPFKCEQSILKLLKHHRPFDSIDSSTQAQKNYHAIFNINGKACPLNSDDDILDLKDIAPDWQDVKILSLISHDCHLLPAQRLQSYWNITQYFNSIVKLHLSCNQADLSFGEELLQKIISNLKSLKDLILIFPNATVGDTFKESIWRISSPKSLILLSKRRINIQKIDLHINKKPIKNKQQECENQPRNGFSPQENDSSCRKWLRLPLEHKFANQGWFHSFLEIVEIDFSSHKDISISKFNFKELKICKPLLKLHLNFVDRSEVTDSLLGDLSEAINNLECLTALNLNFYGCKKISDEGLSRLSYQGLQKLPKLNELSLSFGFCNNIRNQEFEKLISQGIKSLKSLTKLNLNFDSCQNISDEGLKKLGCLLTGDLNTLLDLQLSFKDCINITDLGCEFQQLKSLKILCLNFDGCGMYDGEIYKLSSRGLKYLELLTTLRLSFGGNPSNISNNAFQCLCREGISHLKLLASLHLNFNICQGLSDESLESLCCEGIQRLEGLTSLELISRGENQITEKGIKNIAFKGMSRLILLENLQLPLVRTSFSSSSIHVALVRILTYFGMLLQET